MSKQVAPYYKLLNDNARELNPAKNQEDPLIVIETNKKYNLAFLPPRHRHMLTLHMKKMRDSKSLKGYSSLSLPSRLFTLHSIKYLPSNIFIRNKGDAVIGVSVNNQEEQWKRWSLRIFFMKLWWKKKISFKSYTTWAMRKTASWPALVLVNYFWKNYPVIDVVPCSCAPRPRMQT